MPIKADRVCVLLPGGLGDLVKSSFWLRHLKKQGAEIDLYADQRSRGIEILGLDILRVVDRVFRVPMKEYTVGGYLSFFIRFLAGKGAIVGRRQYSLLLAPLGNPLNKMLSIAIDAKAKYVHFSPKDDVRSEYEAIERIIGPLERPEVDFRYRGEEPDQLRNGSDKKTVLVAMTCRNSPQSSRDWCGFVKLLELLEKDYRVVCADQAKYGDLPHGVLDLRGQASLNDLCSWVSAVDCVVAIDGLTFHLAYAFGKPVVGIFGPGPMEFRVPPVVDRSKIIGLRNVEREPKRGARAALVERYDPEQNPYTRLLSVESVRKAVDELCGSLSE